MAKKMLILLLSTFGLDVTMVARKASLKKELELKKKRCDTMNTVQGKTAIVTGGGKGIGFQCCRQLLRNGAKKVAILGRDNTKNERAATKLNDEFGAGRAIFFPVDVADFEELEPEARLMPVVAPVGIVAFKRAVKSLGGLDILVNNAGIMKDVEWQREIQVNFAAVVKSTLLAYDYMGKHKGGKGGVIVNVSSVLALFDIGLVPVYTATKHAIMAFTVSLKSQYERTGVSVRILCPGVTDTSLVLFADDTHLDIFDSAAAERTQQSLTRQPCEYVGKALVEAIEKGTNGTVWVSQLCDPPFEVELAKYDCIKF